MTPSEYTNSVGQRAEQAVKSFLEGDGYKVIPYGVEYTLKDVAALSTEAYSALHLSDVITSAPDFFVLSPSKQGWWLLEVKYRKCWCDLARDGLKKKLEMQARCWKRVVVLIAVKHPVGPDKLSTSYIRACQLCMDSGRLMAYRTNSTEGREWDAIEWDFLDPIEAVFGACCQNMAGMKRLNKLVETIKKMPEDSSDKNMIDKNLLRKA
ncbi:MAG: hypothetical protein WCO56_00920 [Verrucomicrobiota bacterium]